MFEQVWQLHQSLEAGCPVRQPDRDVETEYAADIVASLAVKGSVLGMGAGPCAAVPVGGLHSPAKTRPKMSFAICDFRLVLLPVVFVDTTIVRHPIHASKIYSLLSLVLI